MPSPLSAAAIRSLRKTWLLDYREDHMEIASTAKTSGAAAAGGDSLALDSLGTGTIQAGTQILVRAAGRADVYTVTATATITANAATVTVSPPLRQAIPDDSPVERLPEYGDIYNVKTNALFWPDSQLQDFAVTAWREYGERIAQSLDGESALFRAIRLVANRHRLQSGLFLEFQARHLQDPTVLIAERNRIQELIREDESQLRPAGRGGFSRPMWK